MPSKKKPVKKAVVKKKPAPKKSAAKKIPAKKKPPVKKAKAKKPAKKTLKKKTAPKKTLIKKPVIKKSSVKKPVKKKAAIKKTIIKKPAAIKTVKTVKAVKKLSAASVKEMPAEVIELFNAFFEDGSVRGKKFLAALSKVSDKRLSEIMQSILWESEHGETMLKYFKEKYKMKDEELNLVKKGRPVKHFSYRDIFTGKVFKKNPCCDEDIDCCIREICCQIICCCRCCHCWPCCNFPFCKLCKYYYKCACKVEVAPTSSAAGYNLVRRLTFPGATITVSGLNATINTGSSPSGSYYTQAQIDAMFAQHA
ncbi:MAG: hypothetical protein JW969_04185, partial [Spirochaetales bacterium]|nr:hypothetical protein [Spirochaetales bacterium]